MCGQQGDTDGRYFQTAAGRHGSGAYYHQDQRQHECPGSQRPHIRNAEAGRTRGDGSQECIGKLPSERQSGERIVHFQQIVEKCTAGKQYQRADHHDVRVDIDNSGGMDIMLLLSDYDLECIDKQMS